MSDIEVSPNNSKSHLVQFIRVAGIIEESIVDGPGLRFVVFTQGCIHNCLGCHNKETHNVEGGKLMSLSEILTAYENSGTSGITLSGGEPFLQGDELALLAGEVHKLGGDVITYSGYEYQELRALSVNQGSVRSLLMETDLLIDGPFRLKERTMDLPFVGSANQKLIALTDRGRNLKAFSVKK